MKRYYLIGIIITLFIVTMIIINGNKGATISLEEAEKIAFSQAEIDGYKEVKAWNRYGSKTELGYTFLPEENKDIKVWTVYIDASHNPPIKNAPAATYMIHAKDGSVVSVIKGLTQAGMDLEIKGTKRIGEGTQPKVVYESKIRNNGNHEYTIEWIEPIISLKKQGIIQEEVAKTEINKIISVNKELTVSGGVTIHSKQAEDDNYIILGLTIKVKEEDQPIFIFDDEHLNNMEE